MNRTTQHVRLLGNEVHHEHATASSLRRKAVASARSGQMQSASMLMDKAAKHDRRMKHACNRLNRPMWVAHGPAH